MVVAVACSIAEENVPPGSSTPAASPSTGGRPPGPLSEPPAAATTPAASLAAGPKRPARLAFVGDVSLSFHVTAYLEGYPAKPPIEPLFPFAAVAEQLRSYDLAVGNLECVIAARGEKKRGKILRAPLSAPKLLLDAGFDLVSVANNHALDLGEEGYRQMLSLLTEAGLPFAGAHLLDERLDPVAVAVLDGLRVAVVGHYNRDAKLALADVARARARADVVVVFVHWGNDWESTPLRFQRQWGRRLIDAGADAVVGTHPHVVQPDELYEGKLISHSLGNFVFAAMTRPGTRTGALLELDVSERGVVDHRYRKLVIDDRGAPSFEGGPTREPPLDPSLPADLAPLGKPLGFGLTP